jgi:diphosphomevalonate decarboxylase
LKKGGKLDEYLIIPLNDSISGTLSIDDMCAQTSVAVSEQFTEDKMWLNGEEVDITSNKRLINCLKQSLFGINSKILKLIPNFFRYFDV